MSHKICNTCGKVKNRDRFWKDSARRDGLRGSCIACEAPKSNERHKPKHRKHRPHTFRRGETIKQRIAFVKECKVGQPCASCGEYHAPDVLDFHHLDESTKAFQLSNVRRLGGRISIADIKNEMSKCVIICSNCHRKLHANLLCLINEN